MYEDTDKSKRSKVKKSNYSVKSERITPIKRADSHADLSEFPLDYPKNRSEFEQLVDASRDALRILNKDFTVRRINSAFAGMTGVNKTEVTGKKCWEMFPSPLCHTSECRLQRIIDGEKTIQVEIERKRKDGSTIPCIVTTSPLLDAKGKLLGIIEQFSDITEYRRLKEQNKESEDLYRSLIELDSEAGEAIVMLQDEEDKEGIQIFVNNHWPRITQYTKEELIGTSLLDLICPRDRQTVISNRRESVSHKNMPGVVEVNIIRKDGIEVPVELTGGFTSYHGKLTNVIYLRDITLRRKMELELKESEEKYRTLFDYVPVGIWEDDYSDIQEHITQLKKQGVKNLDQYLANDPKAAGDIINKRRIINFNKAMVDLLEADSRDEITNGIREKHVSPEYQKLLSEQVSHISKGETHFEYCSELLTFRGNKKYVNNCIAIPPGSKDTLSRVYSSVTDITAIKEAEEEKLKIIKKAEAAHRLAALGEMAAGIAHEINNPMTSITTFSQLMENRTDIPKDVLGWARIIEEQSKLVAKTIQKLLALACHEKLDICPVNLNQLLKDTIELRTFIHDTANIEVITLFDFQIGYIPADSSQLQSVFLNLIVNAEQAIKSNNKKGKLTITTQKQGEYVHILFQDTGPGIPRENLTRIFEPFFTTKRPTEGTGLGLSVSRSIVLEHGGEISVESEIGNGATFKIVLPL
jgi:PAS domain S-box-containing protein